jgi:bud emergence protein 1
MKGIRRSLNKDRIGAPAGATKNGVALPANNAPRPQAPPTPPKAVIRATASYRAQSPQELSFEEGDFFHVVSDDGGEDWFDASNPMTGKRGMVPAEHFQVLGRNARETSMQGRQAKKLSSGSAASVGAAYSPATGSAQFPAAGGSWKPGVPVVTGTSRASGTNAPSAATATSRPGSQSAPRNQPLYGVVQYDFVAERPDELDAKRGEPIIVIAQSNHEWFVAKPIGRLGGPGLIPVAFVQIQDMATGKPVENVEELIRSAVVPKVEEWKKMTADYKQASIPLGRFDFAQPATAQPQQPKTSLSSPSSANMPLSPPPHSAAPSHTQHQSYGSAAGPGESHPYAASSPGHPPDSAGGGGYENRYSYTRERRQFGLVTSASVESFHQEEGSFWFHLRAFFSTGASLILYRLYQDFYDFQIALMDDFPVEAGRVPGDDGHTERILPMMPGPTEYEDEVVCAQRVHDLSIYLADLCTLPERIRGCGLMYEFLVPRAGDVVIADGDSRSYDDGAGGAGGSGHGGQVENQYGELVQYLDQMEPGNNAAGGPQSASGDAVAAQLGRLSLNGGSQAHLQQPQQQQRYYDETPQTASSAASSYRLPTGNAHMDAPFIKIKIFHRNTDDLIAIRVPPTVTHPALLDKVRERLGREVNHLQYREEGIGGARFIGLENDEELERWVRSGAKLVLVRSVWIPSPSKDPVLTHSDSRTQYAE